MSELHHNFKTHRDAWRDAIVGMINASGPSGVDHDERGYWEHELKAYDEAFGSLSSQSPAPIPEQVAQTTFAERLYGNGPDIDQRRDALYTMALIFAAAETDSAREATFEDMFKEFCTVPRIAIFDSLTRHTGAEVATNYTFETEEFFEVEAVERLLATQSAKQGAQPPKTPEDVVAFVGNYYDTMEDKGDVEDIRFQMSVHDLLSALSDWFDDDAAAQVAHAQAEPVAWLEAEPSARGQDPKNVVWSILYSSRIHTKCAPMTSNPVWPLYAAPVPQEFTQQVAPEAPTNEVLEDLWITTHYGHPADFAADVLQRWGGWQDGLLGYGGALNGKFSFSNSTTQQAAKAKTDEQALVDIGRFIATQDNRITDAPIFVVEQKTPVISDADYNDCRVEWRETENGDYVLATTERATRLEALFQAGRKTPGWRRYEVTDVWTFVTACFTEQGCKDYLARNGHNLRETRIYAYGSYRNEEFRAIRNWLKDLAPTASTVSASGAQWISVDDCLPDLHQTVALLDENRWMNTGSNDHNVNWHGAGYLCEFGHKFWSIFGEPRSQCLDAVTHWMPLPAVPQSAAQAAPDKSEDSAMTRDEWIAAAAAKLKPYLDEGAKEYAETLYKDYVEGFGEEWAVDPEGAVAEDMSYWDADE